MDVDWATPVDEVRKEVTRVLEGSDLWDGRRNFVLVSNVIGATLQLQIGVSAANTDNLFALQSLVRQRVVEFLLEQYPESVVRNRTQPLSDPTPAGPPTQSSDTESAELHDEDTLLR
jgi:hypothetical protein